MASGTAPEPIQAVSLGAAGVSDSTTTYTFSPIWARAATRPNAAEPMIVGHKRWMVFATCMLLNAPVGRHYRPAFAPEAPPPWLVLATVDTLLVARLVNDQRTLEDRQPHFSPCPQGYIRAFC